MMREKIYYLLAIAVLLFAIVALVLVFGQNQPTTGQPVQQAASGTTLQALFTSLAARVSNDANFAFRVRVAAIADGSAITVSQAEARVVEVGSDYFCLANSTSNSRVCYPFAQLLAVAVPN